MAKIVATNSYKEPKRASIEKAANGFIVSKGYGDDRFIAKTMAEAQKLQQKLMQ